MRDKKCEISKEVIIHFVSGVFFVTQVSTSILYCDKHKRASIKKLLTPTNFGVFFSFQKKKHFSLKNIWKRDRSDTTVRLIHQICKKFEHLKMFWKNILGRM